MMKYFLMIFLLFACCWVSVAQEDGQEVLRQYKTMQANDNLRLLDPGVALRQQEIEQFIAQKQGEKEGQRVVVSLLFHVLYSDESERIDLQQIHAQVEALNRDFGYEQSGREKLSIDLSQGFSERAVDTDIRFCLAEEWTGGEGNTAGVHYVPTHVGEWTYDDAIKQLESGGVASVESDRYVNVWIADLAEGVSGYAQMPGGPEATDGIVIDRRFFGTIDLEAPYNEGKTLTHLMGNYLGLYPLWGAVSCGDDFVEDTPVHSSANYRCPDEFHISSCDGHPVEMTVNFMDNTFDACQYLFTEGQKWRMQAVLSEEGPRGGLSEGRALCEQEFRMSELSEKEVQLIEQLKVFPNPAKDQLAIIFDSDLAGLLSMNIFNNNGQLFHRQEVQTDGKALNLSVDCSDWPEGIYMIQAAIDGQSWHQKVTVSK